MMNLKNYAANRFYLCIDRSKKREKGRYCNCNESRNAYKECTPDTKAF